MCNNPIYSSNYINNLNTLQNYIISTLQDILRLHYKLQEIILVEVTNMLN